MHFVTAPGRLRLYRSQAILRAEKTLFIDPFIRLAEASQDGGKTGQLVDWPGREVSIRGDQARQGRCLWIISTVYARDHKAKTNRRQVARSTAQRLLCY